ncbi:uncharacterized protein RHO17_021641 [Thomomys bottae]
MYLKNHGIDCSDNPLRTVVARRETFAGHVLIDMHSSQDLGMKGEFSRWRGCQLWAVTPGSRGRRRPRAVTSGSPRGSRGRAQGPGRRAQGWRAPNAAPVRVGPAPERGRPGREEPRFTAPGRSPWQPGEPASRGGRAGASLPDSSLPGSCPNESDAPFWSESASENSVPAPLIPASSPAALETPARGGLRPFPGSGAQPRPSLSLDPPTRVVTSGTSASGSLPTPGTGLRALQPAGLRRRRRLLLASLGWARAAAPGGLRGSRPGPARPAPCQ